MVCVWLFVVGIKKGTRECGIEKLDWLSKKRVECLKVEMEMKMSETTREHAVR